MSDDYAGPGVPSFGPQWCWCTAVVKEDRRWGHQYKTEGCTASVPVPKWFDGRCLGTKRYALRCKNLARKGELTCHLHANQDSTMLLSIYTEPKRPS